MSFSITNTKVGMAVSLAFVSALTACGGGKGKDQPSDISPSAMVAGLSPTVIPANAMALVLGAGAGRGYVDGKGGQAAIDPISTFNHAGVSSRAPNGDVYFVTKNIGNLAIRKIDAEGTISTYMDLTTSGSNALHSQLTTDDSEGKPSWRWISSFAVDGDGNVYIGVSNYTDFLGTKHFATIFKIAADQSIVSSICGKSPDVGSVTMTLNNTYPNLDNVVDGRDGNCSLASPNQMIALSNGSVVVIDGIQNHKTLGDGAGTVAGGQSLNFVDGTALKNTVRILDPLRNLKTVASNSRLDAPNTKDGIGRDAQIGAVQAVALDSAENLVLVEAGNFAANAGSGSSAYATINARASFFDWIVSGLVPSVYARTTSLRKVDLKTGAVTTIASTPKLSGHESGADGSLGAGATFGSVQGLAVDLQGNYLLQAYGSLRLFDGAKISTIAGSQVQFGDLDGLGSTATFSTGSDSYLVNGGKGALVFDFSNARVRYVDLQTGVVSPFAGQQYTIGKKDGAANEATLTQVGDIDVDANGNALFTDIDSVGTDGHFLLRSVSVSGQTAEVKTVANLGGPMLGTKASVVRDSSGNAYVAKSASVGGGRLVTIQKVVNGQAKSWAGGGTSIASPDGKGLAASFVSSTGIGGMVMASGDVLYVADGTRIRKITSDGSVTTLAGGGAAGTGDGTGASASFTSLNGLALDKSGSLIALDQNRIRKVTPDGVVSTLPIKYQTTRGAFGTTLNVDQVHTDASAIAVDSGGAIYVLDPSSRSVKKIDVDGSIKTIVGDGVHIGFSTSNLPGALPVAASAMKVVGKTMYIGSLGGVVMVSLP